MDTLLRLTWFTPIQLSSAAFEYSQLDNSRSIFYIVGIYLLYHGSVVLYSCNGPAFTPAFLSLFGSSGPCSGVAALLGLSPWHGSQQVLQAEKANGLVGNNLDRSLGRSMHWVPPLTKTGVILSQNFLKTDRITLTFVELYRAEHRQKVGVTICKC